MSVNKLNRGLELYYKNLGKQYKNIFLNWFNDNKFEENDIFEDINGNPTDSLIIQFDIDNNDNNLFPLKYEINDKDERNKEIFEIMKYCYYNGEPPSYYNIKKANKVKYILYIK